MIQHAHVVMTNNGAAYPIPPHGQYIPYPGPPQQYYYYQPGPIIHQRATAPPELQPSQYRSTSPEIGQSGGLPPPSDVEEVADETKAIAEKAPKKAKPQKPSKKVLVIAVPKELHTIDTVSQRFQRYGEIVLVRVLKPGRQVCAIVEFEQASSAKKSVEKELESGLRIALLQPGADIALYGSSAPHEESLHSGSSSNGETKSHDESGIDIVSLESPSDSNSSRHSDSDHNDNDHHENTKDKMPTVKVSSSQSQPQLISDTNTSRACHWPRNSESNSVEIALSSSSKSSSSNTPKSEQQPRKSAPNGSRRDSNFNIKAAEFVPRSVSLPSTPPSAISGSPKVTSTGNGRILTTLSVSLMPVKKSKIHRQSKKIDLTGKKHETHQCVSTSSNKESATKIQSSSDSVKLQRYSRDFMMSLKESRMSLQLPGGLPNIPELLPTSKQISFTVGGKRR